MRVGISARGLSVSSGGAKEYIRNLILSLAKLDSENEYIVYYSHNNQVLGISSSNAREVVLPSSYILLWDHLVLPLRMNRDKIEVALFPKGTIPLMSSVKAIVSVLDLGYFYPQLNAYKPFDTLYIKRMMPYAIRKAKAVLAISENTRRDILKFVPDVSAEKVHVTYLASALPEITNGLPNVRVKSHLGKAPYIFISSSLSPRKNIERTLKAFALLRDQIPHNLLITGGKTWGKTQVPRLIEKLQLQHRVIILGKVSPDDLSALYRHASLYVMPSLFEGFSLTLLEAMQFGCPVAASNVASHPEVAGHAAVYFDPYSVDDMAAAILRVLSDDNLQAELRVKGLQQAQKFSWEKCARETLAVINEVAVSAGDA